MHLYKHVDDLSNICVTTVNVRNVFYYKISECAHCPQQAQLLVTHSVLVVWAADDKLYACLELVVFRLTEGQTFRKELVPGC